MLWEATVAKGYAGPIRLAFRQAAVLLAHRCKGEHGNGACLPIGAESI